MVGLIYAIFAKVGFLPKFILNGKSKLIPSIELSDKDDRHILAAAIACKASQIITFNIRDFPKTVLDGYKIVALHPDEFIASLITLKPITMLNQVETVRKRLLYPPKTSNEYLEILLKQGLPLSVSMLKELQNTQNTM
ncbi:hypothetical protein [Pseudanabaena biceps]|uniref:VapC50 C-terminal domain-containing protein n=1 Tax=Pseudanabaena biceps PCC 7429 TaxID=927668 RepID=L8N230_9CYAN|nr:hypothetical protein [Pseudanabaena biceps]ELS32313.1 hypothetical protein Pse7429DRAFT_2491 [Pseudanabaena biceps PCC 7429]